MKILHLITGLNQGGAETMLYKLLLQIDKSKFESFVISMGDEGVFGEKIKALGIPVYCLNMKRGMPSWSGFSKYLQMIKKTQPEIVQSWMYHADFLAAISRPFSVPYKFVFNIRVGLSSHLKKSTRLIISLNALLSRRAAAVINNSQVSQEQHAKIGFSRKNLVHIANGFDIQKFQPNTNAFSEFRKKHGLEDNIKIVGNFARFHSQKDHFGLIEVFKMIKAQATCPVIFVLGGSQIFSSNLQLMQKIQDLGLEKDCMLLGPVDVSQIMPAVDLYISSSLSEGFPNVIGEAMACGVPCVATNVGDCKYIIGELGGIAEPKDYKALAAQALKWMSVDEQVKAQIRQSIVDRYSIQHIVKQYEDLYVEVLSQD